MKRNALYIAIIFAIATQNKAYQRGAIYNLHNSICT